MTSLVGKHVGGGHAVNQPSVPEPSFAERARTLMYLGRIPSAASPRNRVSSRVFPSAQ
jgi:hypothetical protein